MNEREWMSELGWKWEWLLKILQRFLLKLDQSTKKIRLQNVSSAVQTVPSVLQRLGLLWQSCCVRLCMSEAYCLHASLRHDYITPWMPQSAFTDLLLLLWITGSWHNFAFPPLPYVSRPLSSVLITQVTPLLLPFHQIAWLRCPPDQRRPLILSCLL